MITSEEIKRRLWNGANELRGSMDASRYKDYMLGLMFYKFLSDKTLESIKKMNAYEGGSEEELLKIYEEQLNEYGYELTHAIERSLGGYCIEPQYTYQAWVRAINNGEFTLQLVEDSFHNFEQKATIAETGADFKGLFSSSNLDLNDTALGSDLNARSQNIQALIKLFADLNMNKLQESDVLGDAYEYLIGQFAMESGKKAGEFYTPRQVSEVMAGIVTSNKKIKSIYDPTVGSSSLLLTVGQKYDTETQKQIKYYGQEKNTATYNLTRMNLILHGVDPSRMEVRNGDTLAEDWPEDPERPGEGVLFDAVVMNPPYSLKNWNRANITASDPRFAVAGVLPPKSKADFAFLLHGLYHLAQDGTMAIVLPHGVLFRGASEGQIRERLLKENVIDCIIGMPANLFTNTGIPVVVIILKKNREINEPLLIIDASEDFEKAGKQNRLREKDIAKITDTFLNRSEIKGYSHLATLEEITENEYNLNIPRYIDSIDEEIPHDVDAHLYGGIPQKNIADLKILNTVAPEVLADSFDEIRPGYLQLNKSLEDLSEELLNNEHVLEKTAELKSKVEKYIEKYWDILHAAAADTNLNELRRQMLGDIKDLLSEFNYIDVYDGYQVVAEIWNDNLKHDMEMIISESSKRDNAFYEVGRSREANMVTKGSGSNKREEQDGWKGAIISNQLIADKLYHTEQVEIENLKSRQAEIDAELDELVEAAKDEDSEEYDALFDLLRKNKEGEPTNSFNMSQLKKELKEAEDGSAEQELMQKVQDLNSAGSSLRRKIKDQEKQLDDAVQERITQLSDAEIDDLLYAKWFEKAIDELISLIEDPLKEELAVIDELYERYADTVADIDAQIAELEAELKEMMADLVLTE